MGRHLIQGFGIPMKIRPPLDPKRAWTICSFEGQLNKARRYYCKNLLTGVNGPTRWGYGAAFADIPEGEQHNFVESFPDDMEE